MSEVLILAVGFVIGVVVSALALFGPIPALIDVMYHRSGFVGKLGDFARWWMDWWIDWSERHRGNDG